eukprot:scaffold108102_cov69-Phaeocystis_antarctica.AAC.2
MHAPRRGRPRPPLAAAVFLGLCVRPAAAASTGMQSALLLESSGPCVEQGGCLCSPNYQGGACTATSTANAPYNATHDTCLVDFLHPVVLHVRLFDTGADQITVWQRRPTPYDLDERLSSGPWTTHDLGPQRDNNGVMTDLNKGTDYDGTVGPDGVLAKTLSWSRAPSRFGFPGVGDPTVLRGGFRICWSIATPVPPPTPP